MEKQKTSEAQEQAKLIRWANQNRYAHPELNWLHHVPNGGKRDAFTGGQMMALGVKRGVPDLFLDVRRGDCPGIRAEMKTETGSLTEDQKRWMAHYESQGFMVAVWRSAEEAQESLLAYLGRSV